ncbi:hypothetical protein TruAng_004469 [Truncatella angustata]|nr:hypothetical protein TruAng_004469 [Truncatella angustata]
MSQTIEAEESPKVLNQSSTSEQGSSASDRRKERRVRWKTDLIILPLLVSIHFLAQMGRSDLANAKVAGMEEDLHLTPSMYSLTASIFLVGYLVFQLPAMLLMRKVGPPVEFACAMIVWGVVTVCTMKATNQAQLMVCRTLIGASEAFIQGAVLYLSFWYPYTELATRGAIFYSSVALAGSFNGLLAYLIEGNLDGANGWAAIFFIEGLVPMVWAFVILILLPSTPETVKWYFKAEEKEIVIRRSRAAHNTGESKIIPRLIFKVLTQPQFWMVTLIDSGAHFCTTSFSNFVPDIIKGLGFESIQAQLMTVIVYASAFVGIIIAARIADKTQKRGTCIVAAGVYPITLLSLVWVATNNVGYTYRASTAGLINVFAQLVAISSNFAYSDPPYYRQGLAISLAMVSMSGLVAGLQWLYLRRMNRKKAEQQYSAEANNKRSLSIDEIGNAHPDFFFSY